MRDGTCSVVCEQRTYRRVCPLHLCPHDRGPQLPPAPQIVGDHFGVGIDDTHIKLRGAPVLDEAALDAHQKMIADKLSIAELMTVGVTALPPLVPVGHLLDVLRSNNHQARQPLPLPLRPSQL